MDRQELKQTARDILLEAVAAQAVAYAKEIPTKLFKGIKDKFRFSLTIPEDTETYYAFEDWFFQNHEEKFKDVTVYNFAKDDDGKKKRKTDQDRDRYGRAESSTDFGFGIGYSQNSGSTMIKINGTRITVTKTKVVGKKDSGEKTVQFYTLSGTNKYKIKALVEEIYQQYNSDHDQIKVFVSNYYGSWDLVKRIKGKPIDGIILNHEIHSKLVTDLEEFEGDKEWYDKINIPYKRGYLLYGPPGNGKTSLSIAIASKHKRNIYCLDINKLKDDQTLRYAFQNLQANSLLLIEDIDAAFQKRDVVTTETVTGYKKSAHQITFACLLNCLDGVYYKDGLVTLMTTNHLGRLDEALIRPGRMDMRVLIDNPTVVEVEAYVSRFYGAKVELARYVQKLSMAQVQGVCITNRKDVNATIAELESDAITINLGDTPEILELIEEYDTKPVLPDKKNPMQMALDLIAAHKNGADIKNTIAALDGVAKQPANDDLDDDDPDDDDDEDAKDRVPSSADSLH